jgi:Asp-tRNA(Asn)/Glu-tRNA(Gln) amidotransferase A subunit family amidase
MDGIDALVAPSVPVLAPSIERIRQFQVELNDGLHPIGTPDGGTILTRNSTLCNVTGAPAITVPSGLSASGLPAGIQFIGHAWSEPALLSLARALEGARGGPLRPAFGWETPR